LTYRTAQIVALIVWKLEQADSLVSETTVYEPIFFGSLAGVTK